MAAAMSDPVPNPAFRRRWREPQAPVQPALLLKPGADPVGPIGLALLEAWRRDRAERRAATP